MGKLTKQQQQLVAFLVVFIVGGGYFYWNFMLKPTLENIRIREEKHKDLIVKIENAERQARRLPALQNELASLQVELASLEKQLPKDKDTPNIIRTLTREALQESLMFTRLAPRPATRQQYFEIISFDLQLVGSLHSLARFLASLGQQDRIFQAQNITLALSGTQADTSTGANLAITLTILTYAYSG